MYKEETLLLSWKVQPGSSGRSTSVCSVVLVMDGKPVHSGVWAESQGVSSSGQYREIPGPDGQSHIS